MEREYRWWKLVPDYPDYLVSSCGLVMRLTRGARGAKAGHILKPGPLRGGYRGVALCRNGAQMTRKVHRLVAAAFIPNPHNLPQVNHRSGNKQDNSVANLEWCSSLDNMRHSFKMGLHRGAKGATHVRARLTESDVFTIRKLKTHGATRKELATRYSVTVHAITDILLRRNWTHI